MGDAKAAERLLRAHGASIFEAAEAAEMDAALWAFLKARLSMTDKAAGTVIAELREFRYAEGHREGDPDLAEGTSETY